MTRSLKNEACTAAPIASGGAAAHGPASLPAAQGFALAADGRMPGLLSSGAGPWADQAIIMAMALPVMRIWRAQSRAPKVNSALSEMPFAAGLFLLLRWAAPGN